MPLPLLCEKSEAILLVIVGLMASLQAGRQVGWLASNQKTFKIYTVTINVESSMWENFHILHV